MYVLIYLNFTRVLVVEICGSFPKVLFKNVSVTLKIVLKDIRPEDVSTEHNRRVFSNPFHMCVKSPLFL